MSELHERMAREREDEKRMALESAALKVGDPVRCYGNDGEITGVFVRRVDGKEELYYRRRWTTPDGEVHDEDCIGWACPGGIRRRGSKPKAKPEKKPRKLPDPRGLKSQRKTTKQAKEPPGPKCRSCGAPIAWCVTESDKRIPLDTEPVPDGNLVVVAQFGNAPGLALSYDPEKHDGGWARWKAHFATCPNADEHRRPRARQEKLL